MLVFLRGFAPGPARAALKPHSARHGLGSKTVEQELTEGTEVLRYLCYLLFYEFGCCSSAKFRIFNAIEKSMVSPFSVGRTACHQSTSVEKTGRARPSHPELFE